MNGNRRDMAYLGASLILLFSLACNAVTSIWEPTEVPPSKIPPPKATVPGKAPPVTIPTRTPLPDYNGNWSGETSQGKPVFLNVRNNRLEFIVTGVELQGDGCTSNFAGTLSPSDPISTAGFAARTNTINPGSVTVYGIFDTGRSASGMIVYGQIGGNCRGSVQVDWTATKDDS